MPFPAWPEDLTPDQLEQRQLALWKEEGLFRRTLEANRLASEAPLAKVLTGPGRP